MPGLPGHFRHHCLPAEVISHAVGLYYRFPFRHRDVEELLTQRRIEVSHETVSTPSSSRICYFAAA